MKKRLSNPYLPLNVYIPDGEPRIFEGRLYVYGSHDEEKGKAFCPLDYEVWSAPIDDLSDWVNHGIIYRKDQDPENRDGNLRILAPDVEKGTDGRYYLYYSLDMVPEISVAVCDSPAGRYEYLGRVHYGNGTILRENMPFDPAVMNDDGRIFLYYGFAPDFPIHGKHDANCPGCSCVELETDMVTIKNGPEVVIPSYNFAGGSDFEKKPYFEAPSIRKIENLYYLVYCPTDAHQLCYAFSDEPDRGYRYGGIIVSNGDIGMDGRTAADSLWTWGNNHGGLAEIGGQLYIFYHRHTHGTMFSRQGCAEPVIRDRAGRIIQSEMTSGGLRNEPYPAVGLFPAPLACNLSGKNGSPKTVFGKIINDAPIVSSQDGVQFITQIEDGTIIGYKYFRFAGSTTFGLTYRGLGKGTIGISLTRDEEDVALIELPPAEDWTTLWTDFSFTGVKPLYLRYTGSGSMDLLSLEWEATEDEHGEREIIS